MPDSENFEDTIDSADRMLKAGRVFSFASTRALQFLGLISGVRDTVEKTMPFGKQALESENVVWILEFLQDPKTAEIFKDPQAMKKGEYRTFAKDVTERSMVGASNLVAAASLVFAHAVFDATLFDYCRTIALWSWKEWVELVKDRKVSIAEVKESTKYRTLLDSIDKYLSQLERESILKKADTLYRVIRPGDYASTVREYVYSRERLEAIDRARHEAVHQLRFHKGFEGIEETISYLRKTVVHFMGLIHRRYGLKIDPNVSADGN